MEAGGVENFPQGSEGRTRDIVAEKLGIGSGKQYEKEKYIVDNANEEILNAWDKGDISTNKVYISLMEEKKALESENQQLKNKPPKIVEKEWRIKMSDDNNANNIYILSIEGAKIWEHMNRDEDIFKKYVGMIPYSLELIKLQKEGLKTFTKNKNNKNISNDIINIKFNSKVKSATEIIKSLNKKLETEKLDDCIKENIDNKINKLEKIKDDPNWQEIKLEDLRDKMYNEGFTIKTTNKKTGEIKETEYVVYKRSSAKSRTGQVLFIKKQLKNEMIKWARMGMNLEGRNDIDYPSLLAYESLVSSSIEDTIHIPAENILIIDDVKSKYKVDVNVVEKDKSGLLISRPEDNYEMESDLFDGEGLLDSSLFINNRKNKGMMLLRQHMFKSCVFNTNIQKFLKDNCPEHIIFEEWELKNMFDEIILAKDVKMIITPNSLKALKFSTIKDTKKKMWQHWKKIVSKDDCIFGICKSEKPSTKGLNKEGNIINQTSYQMLNSMPISNVSMEELSKFEIDYIKKLKNDDKVYIEYLLETKNDMNCNEMLADLYKKNINIINTKMFKDIRKKDINKYVTHCKRGKIRLNGDYLIIMQNGKELLYHSIGKLPVNKNVLIEDNWKDNMILTKNEVYTTQHPFKAEYTAFRNPHTSPSNVLIVKNKDSEFIKKYFNLSENIIYTNAINFEINRVLSGQDVDSDSLILFNSEIILKIAKKCYGSYRVCVNNVDTDLNKYKVVNTDMAKIDSILANSQQYIGRVVNLGQLYMSTYWDLFNEDENLETLKELMQNIDICTVLSEISIDSAKRMYDIDIEKQINSLSGSELLKQNRPNFFKYISQNKNIGKKVEKYDTSMDYLFDIMSNIANAEERDTIELEVLLIKCDDRIVKRRQVEGIIKNINEMTNKIKYVEIKYACKNEVDKDEKYKEKYNEINDVKNKYMNNIKKYKIKKETICSIIKKVFSGKIECKYKTELLNALFNTNKDVFLSAFKAK